MKKFQMIIAKFISFYSNWAKLYYSLRFYDHDKLQFKECNRLRIKNVNGEINKEIAYTKDKIWI